jgi:ATP-dependent DNA helicase RecG
VFGDLDVSTLRELPLGRSPISTHVIPVLEKPTHLERAWSRIKEDVANGHQAYIVAPRISAGTPEDADLDFLYGQESKSMASVEELAPELHGGALKGLKLAPLHGRQTSELKDATMKAFAAGEIDVLVSTTVIEVGVDVPNATVMVIMDADRFGVSQLHQLRGRIGRGSAAGLCLLVTGAEPETPARVRLEAVAATQDGFELSRIDLEQRREGDVMGASQSGAKSKLRLLRVLRDEAMIEVARDEATALIEQDPTLSQESELAKALAQLESDTASEFIDRG